MHSATALGFSTRRPGDDYVFVGNFQPGGGRKPQTSPVLGLKSASLRHGAEIVIVVNIRPGAAGRYIGTITGFEHPHTERFAGMRIGDLIAFEEAHVFSGND